MKNKMTDLRGHLFDVIERLKDPSAEKPMEAKTAEAICTAAKRLIETADIELRARAQFGSEGATVSDFLELQKRKQPRLVRSAA